MIYHITIVIFSLFPMYSCQTSTLTIFTRDAICHVTDTFDKGCYKEAPADGNLKQCARLCSRDDSCIGASLDDTGKCFLQQQCSENPICTEEDSNPRYVSRYCVNGTWDFSSQSCKCAYGFHGDRCEHYPRTCRDLISAGYSKNFYRAYMDPFQDGKNPVLPICYISPPSYAQVKVLFNKGRQNFNMSWDDYAKGFYIDESHLWSGLDSLHAMTAAGYNKLFYVFYSYQEPQNHWNVYGSYSGFRVSSGNDLYTFTYEHFQRLHNYGIPPSGVYLDDCLSSLKNTSFSTWDNDHDGVDQENCASRAGSGWWYSGCNNPCNALGWRFDYRDNTPSHQLFSLKGVDIEQVVGENVIFDIFFEC